MPGQSYIMLRSAKLNSTMGFFDLNIPFLENTKSSSSQNQTLKQNRLKYLIRSIEFGYTGVAYNRTIKGVMSDADYCSIPLFTPSSLMKLLPALSASAKFHRELLGVPVSAPFRQYTRVTVCVDTAAQATLLNSSNPVLKSYNIVAVKPLNQNAFDQACQFSEVDIISIDFTDKLPFRLKQPIIKAAIKRGVYFEIMYYGLIRDAQTRCQLISNAKMLVDWTSGKNIILTSATSSANELRGPYDIANLASLLGMSMERAKAAVSRNCRNLLIKALRKRQYHNEAIKVEPLTDSEQLKFSNLSSVDSLNWDPISSGQGDLLLDNVEKVSLALSDHRKVKAVDFTSIMNELPPFLLGEGGQPDLLSQNGVLITKDDIKQSEEFLDSPKQVKNVMVHSVSSPLQSLGLLDFQNSNIKIPENNDAAVDIHILENDRTVEATSQVNKHNIILGGSQVHATEHKDAVNREELVEPCTEVGRDDSLVSAKNQTEDLIMDNARREDDGKLRDEAMIGKHRDSKKSSKAAIFPPTSLLNRTQFKNKQRKLKRKAKKV